MNPIEGVPYQPVLIAEPVLEGTNSQINLVSIQGQHTDLPNFSDIEMSIEIKTSSSEKAGPKKFIMPHHNLRFLKLQALEFA